MSADLSAGLEDYLEIICSLIEAGGSVKAAEIARKLNVSRASVSEALMRLADKKLIVYEGRKGLEITPEGLKTAKEVIEKHKTLTALFEEVLGLNREISEDNACRIEHIINNEVFCRIKNFLEFCRKNNELIQEFKKENINNNE